jgi:hypothetical protein
LEAGPGVSNNPASGFALAHLLAQAREALIAQLVRAHTLALARWRAALTASRCGVRKFGRTVGKRLFAGKTE